MYNFDHVLSFFKVYVKNCTNTAIVYWALQQISYFISVDFLNGQRWDEKNNIAFTTKVFGFFFLLYLKDMYLILSLLLDF